MQSKLTPLLRVPRKLVKNKVILVGGENIAEVEEINKKLLRVRKISEGRGFHCYDVNYKDVDFTLCITPVGGSNTDIAVQELAFSGAKIIIRAGTSGAISEELKVGDLVVTQGAVRCDGASPRYVLPEYPASAHYKLVSALVKAAKIKKIPCVVGITLSTASFYAINRRLVSGKLQSVSFGGYEQTWQNNLIVDMKKANVLNVEMETATLLTLGNIFGLKTGSVCGIADRVPWRKPPEKINFRIALENCLPVAYESLRFL